MPPSHWPTCFPKNKNIFFIPPHKTSQLRYLGFLVIIMGMFAEISQVKSFLSINENNELQGIIMQKHTNKSITNRKAMVMPISSLSFTAAWLTACD